MMYSKSHYNKLNEQKVLRKIKKHWVVVSVAMLGMIGGTKILTSHAPVVHADTISAIDQSAATSSSTASMAAAASDSHTASVQNSTHSSSSTASDVEPRALKLDSAKSSQSVTSLAASNQPASSVATSSSASSTASSATSEFNSNVTIQGSLVNSVSPEQPMGKDNYNQYSLVLNNNPSNESAANIAQGTSLKINVNQAASNSITINKVAYDSTLFSASADTSGNYVFTAIKAIPPLSTTINLGFMANDPGYNWDGKDNATNPAVAPVTFTASGDNGSWNTPGQTIYVQPTPKQISYGGQGNGYMIGGNVNNDQSVTDLLNFVTADKDFPYQNAKTAYLGYGYNGIPNFYDASKAKLADGSYFMTNILRTNAGSQNVLLQMNAPDYPFDLDNSKLIMQYNSGNGYANSHDVDITNADGVQFNTSAHQIKVDVSKFKQYQNGIMSLVTFVKIPAGIDPANIKVPVTAYHTWTDNGNLSQTSSDTLPHVGYLLQSGTAHNPFFTGEKDYHYVLTPGSDTVTFDNGVHALKADYDAPNNYFPFYVTPADETTAKQFPASMFPTANSGKYGFDGVNLTFNEAQLVKHDAFDANNNATFKFNLTTAPYNDVNGHQHTDTSELTFNIHKVIDSVHVVYVDQTDHNQNLKTVNVEISKKGQTIPYHSGDDLKTFESQHYLLAHNDYDAEQTPTYDGTDAYYIYLQHQLQTGDTNSTSLLTNDHLDLNNLTATLTDQVTGKKYLLTQPKQVNGLSGDEPGIKAVTYIYGAPTDQKVQFNEIPNSNGKVYVSEFDTHDIHLIAGPKTQFVPSMGITKLVNTDAQVVNPDHLLVTGDQVNPKQPGTYQVQYTYSDELHHQFNKSINVIVSASKANVKVHDVNLVAGPKTKWSPADGFSEATDELGNPLSLSQINVIGQANLKLDVVGDYPIHYSYTDKAGNLSSAISHVHVSKPIPAYRPTNDHASVADTSAVISTNVSNSISTNDAPNAISTNASSAAHPTNSSTTTSSSMTASASYNHHRVHVAKKHAKGFQGQRVYNVDSIYTYQRPTFKLHQRKRFFKRAVRIKRAMFKVIGVKQSKFGRRRLLVIRINSKTNRVMKSRTQNIGYITARRAYIRPLYYQSLGANTNYRVMQKLYEYQKANLSGKRHLLKVGKLLNARSIRKLGTVYRIKLTNGKYITANKRYVTLHRHLH